jgi:type III pantothenate kinase
VILLVDIGNTRIKWATLTESGLGVQQAVPYADWTSAQLDSNLLASLRKPSQIFVSNVGGESIAKLLSAATLAKWSIEPQFIRSLANGGGIQNAYTNAEQLGVDRWLAMIAAHSLIAGPVCVASIGTAMTVDGVDAQGKHRGGIIVPGPDLAVSSLLKSTSDLASRSKDGKVDSALFADNTLGAIQQGIAHMLAAVVEKCVREMEKDLAIAPTLIVTGGAADRVAPAFTQAFRSVPDLVLRGLAVVAQS